MGETVVPRQIVKLGFRSARLPLTIAERVVERAGLDMSVWPPVIAYDAAEGQAKQLLGHILHDDELVDEGTRQQSAARHRAGAEVLSTEADEIRRSADSRLEERVDEAEKGRDEAHRQAEQRKAEVRREEEKAKQEARQRARAREEAVKRAARARDKAVQAKERQAELARVEAEARALEKESQAVQAERVVTTIDEHLEEKKAARRNGEGTA